jgi:uncharacterized membrane protein YedE/YeeE
LEPACVPRRLNLWVGFRRKLTTSQNFNQSVIFYMHTANDSRAHFSAKAFNRLTGGVFIGFAAVMAGGCAQLNSWRDRTTIGFLTN